MSATLHYVIGDTDRTIEGLRSAARCDEAIDMALRTAREHGVTVYVEDADGYEEGWGAVEADGTIRTPTRRELRSVDLLHEDDEVTR